MIHHRISLKPSHVIFAAATLSLFLATLTHAQMGMDFFKRPAISAIFHPIVGSGAVYDSSSGSGSKDTMEMLVVGKEPAGGREAYWLEFSMDRGKSATYAKFLLSKDDFQVHRMIIQMAGQPAMEMPANMLAMQQNKKIVEEMSNWAQVGTESVTVPAGTFSCSHWKKNDGSSEVWASDTVSPFGMVKQTGSNGSQVLVKVLTGVQDHITGPITTFQIPGMPQAPQSH